MIKIITFITLHNNFTFVHSCADLTDIIARRTFPSGVGFHFMEFFIGNISIDAEFVKVFVADITFNHKLILLFSKVRCPFGGGAAPDKRLR